MRSGFLAILLIITGCASTPKPAYFPVAVISARAPHSFQIEFRKEELWRPHGFNPWPFPRKATFSTFMIVPVREGDVKVSDIRLCDEIGTTTALTSDRYQGHVLISADTIVVDLHVRWDDQTWHASPMNGTYKLEKQPNKSARANAHHHSFSAHGTRI